MPREISDDDYYLFDRYVRAVLQRYRRGEETEDLSVLAIMDPLTALLDGQGVSDQAFLPYIRARMQEWGLK